MRQLLRSKSVLLILVVLALWTTQTAYWVHQASPGQSTFWETRSLPLVFRPWEGFQSPIPNTVDGSDFENALIEGISRWVQTSSIAVVYGEPTPRSETAKDDVNILTIADTTANRNIVGGALAVSLNWWSGTRRLETDIVFHPDRKWSTVESDDPNARNFLKTAQHEIGHSLNLGHTIGRSAVLHPTTGGGFDFGFSALTWDDIAGLNSTYPVPGIEKVTGSVSGKVTRNGSPVPGAFVVAVDEFGLFTASGFSQGNGDYEIKYLPRGSYSLYVEPLDGPEFEPQSMANGGLSEAQMVTDFLPQFYQNNVDATVNVNGEVTGIDFSVQQGNAAIDPLFLGTDTNLFDGFGATTAASEANQTVPTNFIVGGDGVDQIPAQGGVTFLGPDLQVGAQNFSGSFSDGTPVMTFPLTVPEGTPVGPRSLIINGPQGLGVTTGALQVYPEYRFGQRFAQFVHLPGSASSELFLINTNLDNPMSGQISTRSSSGDSISLPLEAPSDRLAGDTQISLPPGGTRVYTTSGNTTFVGSIHAQGDRNLAGTALVQTEFGTTGVGPSRPLYHFIGPIQVEGGGTKLNTGLAVTNLDERPARIHIRVNDKGGRQIREGNLTLAPRGHSAKFIREMVSGLPTDFLGTAVFTSDRLIAATIIRTAPGTFTTFPVVQARPLTRSFFAQFAHVGNLTSSLLLVNPSPVLSATVTVQIRNSSGAPASVVLNGQTSGDGRRLVVIPPLGCETLLTGGNGSVVGSAEISSSVPVGGVVLFSGPGIGTAGVGESFTLDKAVIPIVRDTGNSTDMGVAVVNPEDEGITLELTVRDSQGAVIRGPKDIALGARRQLARFQNEAPFGLNLPSRFEGSLWIRVKEPNRKMALTAIRQSPGVLTTFPAISLAQPFQPMD